MNRIDEAIEKNIKAYHKHEEYGIMVLLDKDRLKQSIREAMLKAYKETNKKRKQQGFSSLSEFFREFLDCLFGEEGK